VDTVCRGTRAECVNSLPALTKAVFEASLHNNTAFIATATAAADHDLTNDCSQINKTEF
jgi:hypothetical protein